ncbi:MAG: putative Ig domain-containing protein [Opitutaceae bacterium]
MKPGFNSLLALAIAVCALGPSAALGSTSVSLSSPSDGSSYSGASPVAITVSGSVSVGSGSVVADIGVTLDGAYVEISQSPTGMGTTHATFTTTASVTTSGSHQIIVTGADQFGDQGFATSNFTVTIGKAAQAAVSSSSTSLTRDAVFAPTFSGGSGTGGWQFCVEGYTNWDAGASSYTGTNLGPSPGNSPQANWQPSWTANATPGNLTFYIARDEDANYSPAVSSPYTLTINGPVDGITWQTINGVTVGQGSPSYSGVAGHPASFSVTVKNTGTSTWSSNYYLGLWDQNGTGLSFPSVSNTSPGGTVTATYNFTLPSAANQYKYTMQAEDNGVQYFGPTETITINVANLPVITSATSVSGTVGSPFTYTVTASGIPTPSYGVTGTLPPGLSATGGVISGTPSAAGTYTNMTISASNSAGNVTAQLTIVISNPVPQPPVITSSLTASGSVGSSFSYQITGTNSPTSYGASNLPPGLSLPAGSNEISGTPTQAGSRSSTISATNAGGTGSATLNFTISKGTQSAVSVTPGGNLSYPQGETVTFIASGGSSTGSYVWSGSGSGSGPSDVITFNNTGTFTVQVYRAADSNYLQSATATANVTITSGGGGGGGGGDPTQLKVLVPTQ